MQTAELLILLLISLAGFGLLARKLQVPEPIVLVLGGLAVILMTLVGQGLTLPSLIRRLRLTAGHSDDHLERDARQAATKAALTRIEQVGRDERFTKEAVEAITTAYQERMDHLGDELAETLGWSPNRQRSVEGRRLRREALAAERQHLIALHRQHRLSKELLHKLERELDLEEARLG